MGKILGAAVIMTVLLAVNPALILAENDDTAVQIMEALGYEQEDAAVFAVSKVWPADETKTIAALAIPSESGEDGVSRYDLDVVVVDSGSLTVIARYTEKKAIASDAVSFNGFAIDTAAYRLSKTTRAFGVRMGYEGSSRVNPYSCEVIDLFVISGKSLKMTAGPLQVSKSSGEWDGNCAGEFTDTVRTISLGKNQTRGYKDLIVEGKVTTRVSKPDKDGNCNDKETQNPGEKFTLKYDGKQYKLPGELVFR
jgi:hypothetical protein